MRPWEALSTMLGRAVLRSDTKLGMAQIGISLHAVKSKESYSVQFVCNRCKRSTDVLFPVCDDRFLRDQADMTMLQVFAPCFKVLDISLPAPPRPPPPPPMPPLGYAQTQFAPPRPPPRAGSRSSNLLLPNVAELEADKLNTGGMRQCRLNDDTETTASVTSRCGKRDGDDVSSDTVTVTDCVPYYPPAPSPAKWECYWNHGRSQQPVDATAADAMRWPWQWTGAGPNDWERSPSWSWTGDGQWQWD